MLNSYAGLAACATGFALSSDILIICGGLDGSSGLLLSMLMSKAMNRSFSNVLFGAFGWALPAAAAAPLARPIRQRSDGGGRGGGIICHKNISVTTVGGAVTIDGSTTYTMNNNYGAISSNF